MNAPRSACLLALCFTLFVPAPRHGAAAPVKLIFDTDVGNDVDDALALALIHELVDRGEAELLAVTISKANPWAAAYVDAVNTFYGRPDVPIGLVREGKTPADGKFIRAVAERRREGELVYPRDLDPEDAIPDALDVLRRTLAAQPDGSVVLVSVGFLTNMAALVGSSPDAFSPLSGPDLIRAKISRYVAMAGAFGENPRPEYNAFTDAAATRRVLEQWPGEIIASGFEIGLAILYPATSIERDFAYVVDHPVAESYRLYLKMPYDRPTWDLTAVLLAVRPAHDYFGLSPPGAISLSDGGLTEFMERPAGRHRFFTVTPEQIVRATEAFANLVSSPPKI